jgi:hypothetical protein
MQNMYSTVSAASIGSQTNARPNPPPDPKASLYPIAPEPALSLSKGSVQHILSAILLVRA